MAPRTCGSRATASASKRAGGLDALAEHTGAAAGLLKLLANEHRLLVLCLLSARGEMSAGKLVVESGLSQSALSQHLARLRADGIVAFRRDAQMLYYRMADTRASRVLDRLNDIYRGDAP
jgi:DNA-binding transcriptional ArsR family regulator